MNQKNCPIVQRGVIRAASHNQLIYGQGFPFEDLIQPRATKSEDTPMERDLTRGLELPDYLSLGEKVSNIITALSDSHKRTIAALTKIHELQASESKLNPS